MKIDSSDSIKIIKKLTLERKCIHLYKLTNRKYGICQIGILIRLKTLEYHF